MSRYTDLRNELNSVKLKVALLEKQQVKKEYPFNPERGEPDYNPWCTLMQTTVDLSPAALFERIEQLAEVVGVKLRYVAPANTSATYKAEKIKKNELKG